MIKKLISTLMKPKDKIATAFPTDAAAKLAEASGINAAQAATGLRSMAAAPADRMIRSGQAHIRVRVLVAAMHEGGQLHHRGETFQVDPVRRAALGAQVEDVKE